MILIIPDLAIFILPNFKGKDNLYLKQSIKENRKIGNNPKSFYEANIKLMSKQGKNSMKYKVIAQ